MREFITSCEKDTQNVGALLASECKEGDFLALYGEMGSGKTVFMRGFVSVLVPNALVSSPTYAILNVYEGENVSVNHFDMYRITSEEDLYSTGYEETIQHGITVCEWSENIEDFLPEHYIRIVFSKTGENGRMISVERV